MDQTVLDVEQAKAWIRTEWNRTESSFCLSRLSDGIQAAHRYIDLDLSSFFEVVPLSDIQNVQIHVIERSTRAFQSHQ